MQLPCITRRLLGIEVPALSHRACRRYTSSIVELDRFDGQEVPSVCVMYVCTSSVGGFFQVMYVMSYADYPEWQLSFAALE